MSYKVRSRKKDLGEYESIEWHKFLEKHKNKPMPPFFKTVRFWERDALYFPYLEHQKGNFVEYKGRLYMVTEVSNKGVHLLSIRRRSGAPLLDNKKLPKTIFVPEKEYRENTEYVPVFV